MASEATSLLCSALMKRKQYRDDAIAYLAQKRGIDPELLVTQILTDSAPVLTTDDYAIAVQDLDRVEPEPSPEPPTPRRGKNSKP